MPVAGCKKALKERWGEHQLQQLSRCFRRALAIFGLDKLTVRDAFHFVWCVRRSLRCIWRRSGTGERAERAFPESTMSKDALDHVHLATLDEADDLHLPTTTQTRQRIHLVHALDEHRPSGNGKGNPL